jgi:glutathione S-transferase
MEYLDEVYPEIALSPSEPKRRAQMRAWLRFFEEVPTVAVRFPSYNAAFARHFEKMSDEGFKALAKSTTSSLARWIRRRASALRMKNRRSYGVAYYEGSLLS